MKQNNKVLLYYSVKFVEEEANNLTQNDQSTARCYMSGNSIIDPIVFESLVYIQLGYHASLEVTIINAHFLRMSLY